MAGKPRNLGLTYIDKTGVRRWREWRGIKDTLIDYGWWCVMWKDMIKFVLRSPLQVVKGIFRYRWMLTYLTLPQFIDRQLEGRFNGRTAQPLEPSPAPGCDEPTSRCQTMPSIWTLGQDQPVIPEVPFIR